MKFVNPMGNSYVPNNWLTFNDVLLKPQRSRFKSRNDKEISLSCYIGANQSLDIPIISANMDTVTGLHMAKEMSRLGGLGILHRFYASNSAYMDCIEEVFSSCNRVSFSIGCGKEWIKFAENVVAKLGTKDVFICLDVAHGHMEQSIETVEEISKSKAFVIAGNIATEEGALDLVEAGAGCLKVGIGSGSVCTTRIVTGHGVPQLSAIMIVKEALDRNNYYNCGIIADGGIRNSGDMVKAFAAGADAVMLGSLLAGCAETPGDIRITNGKSYKTYRGQSSRHFLNDIGKIGVASEGESTSLEYKGHVANILSEFLGGIRSGLTYSGACDIYDLQRKASFMEISNHAWVESMPHALIKS